MDINNLQKQDVKPSFTMDTTAQTQIYNSVFSNSLYTVKQDNFEDRRTDFEKREEMERRRREMNNQNR